MDDIKIEDDNFVCVAREESLDDYVQVELLLDGTLCLQMVRINAQVRNMFSRIHNVHGG